MGGFKATLESCDQLPNLLRVLSISMSLEVKSCTVQWEYKVVSYTYWAHLVVVGRMLFKSATKRLKMSGPNMEPCGIPNLVDMQWEDLSSICMNYVWPNK